MRRATGAMVTTVGLALAIGGMTVGTLLLGAVLTAVGYIVWQPEG